jgi:nucleotide-binding universal stress UspA family protein
MNENEMVGQVVVGYDGSDTAAAALAWGTDEARMHGAELVVISVLERRMDSNRASDDPDVVLKLREGAEKVIGDRPADLRIRVGSPAAELTAACAPGDRLVVGSRGLSRFAGLRLGSVSRACLYQAPCPVAVVRRRAAHPRPRRKVVVGVDGSANGDRALLVAAEEARIRGAALHAVHASHWEPVGLIAPTSEELIAWGENLIAKHLERTGVQAQPVVRAGHAADVLVRSGRYADLLVVGSRGRNPLMGLLLGSVSDYCAQHAPCPVLVVPPSTE